MEVARKVYYRAKLAEEPSPYTRDVSLQACVEDEDASYITVVLVADEAPTSGRGLYIA